MSEKRRVLVGSSTATTSKNDTPTRHGVPGRASPAIATSARAKVILNNNSHAGLSTSCSPGQAAAASSSSGTSTPTARGGSASTPSQASGSVTRSSAGQGYAASPSAGSSRLPGQVRARVLGYGGQQQQGDASSPLASTSAASPSVYRTPPANILPVTPGSSYTPHAARAQAAGTAGSSRLGAATPSSASSESERGKHASSSSTAFPAASRKIRAASTPPSHDSPTVHIASASADAPPPSPRRRAFPAFASSSERSSSPSFAQQQSSNAAARPPLRVRGISARSAVDMSSNSSPAAAAAARSDPTKSKLVHASKSMTSRPAAAAPSGLLPSPSIRPSNSTIFLSTSTSSAAMAHSASAPSSHALPSPTLPSTGAAYSQSPTTSTSASTVRPSSPFKPKTRPVSPSHVLRPHASTRPGSPERSASARSAIQTSPRRPGIAARSVTVPAPAPPARITTPTSPVAAAAKRPSAASQSSSIASTSTSTADVSATTANTSFSPDLLLSDSAGKASRTSAHSTASTSASTAPTSTTSAAIASHNINSGSNNGYHRSRRRSQSTSSSISSLSGFGGGGGGSSSNLSKSRPLSAHINGNTTQETAARPRGNSFAAKSTTAANSNKNVGIGISIPLASPAGASLPNMLVSPGSRGAGPFSPGKSVRSEHDKAEQAAHQDAKVHRKILDLEITNTSLLAINASLEKAKIKQAAEVRDLRRRLRERSLAPFPSNGAAPLLSPLSDGMSPWERDVDFGAGAGTGDEDAPEQTWEEMLRQDEKFADLVRLLDGMHRKAREALDRTVKSEEKLLGGRVLNHFSLLNHDMHNSTNASKKLIIGHAAEMSTATSACVSVNGEAETEVEGEDEDEGTAPDTPDVSGLSDLKATAAALALAAATPRLGTAGIKTRQREASAETEGDSTEQSSSIEISGVNSTEFSISID